MGTGSARGRSRPATARTSRSWRSAASTARRAPGSTTTGRCTSTASRSATDGIADAVARHRRARACEREDTLGVARALDLAPAVGTCWLAGAAPGEDPLLALELERHPNVRLAEGHGEAAFYEAVVTTLMERRS